MGYITKLRWEDGLAFDVELQGHHFKVDADEEFGGRDRGPRPKTLVLSALAGCTGMDVASILQKMRMSWETFLLEVDAVSSDSHPVVYTEISVRYILTGDQLDRKKIERAVSLSREKYCGVAAMLEKTAKIKTEIILNPSST
jgi:putative redox protein